VSSPPASPGQDNDAILRDWNVPGELIEKLREKKGV
jgi:alpha-methylacyl-CoA racemase